MGNLITRGAGGKVIFSDGSVAQELNMEQPVTAAELMLDHPQHFVAEFNKAKTNRPAPLPADQTLHTDKVYVMIPIVKKDNVSAAVTAANAAATRAILTKSVFLSCSTWMCPATGIGIRKRGRRMRREFVLDEVEEKKESSPSSLLLLEGLNHERPEYLNIQIPAKGWKPTLDTITESTVETKIPHWLF